MAWKEGGGTHHDLVTFDQRASEVGDLHMDGFDEGGLQVAASEWNSLVTLTIKLFSRESNQQSQVRV